MADLEKAKLWSRHILAYQNSGIPAPEWCKNNNVILGRLRYWISKLNVDKNFQQTEWISLNKPQITASIPSIKIKTGDLSIEIPDGFQAETLNSIFKVLGIHA